MPLVPYYLGRPAHVWIAAMARRGSAQKADNASGVVCDGSPVWPEAAQAKAAHHGADLADPARPAAAGV
jgi:hypothetical protein